MRGFKIYRQHDAMDCGPVCLKMIIRHHGKNVSLDTLKRDCDISKRGVSLLALSDTAENYGFRTIAAKLTIDQLLNDAALPCILLWNNNHFVVLQPKGFRKRIVIADPARGKVVCSKKEFLDSWAQLDTPEGKKDFEYQYQYLLYFESGRGVLTESNCQIEVR